MDTTMGLWIGGIICVLSAVSMMYGLLDEFYRMEALENGDAVATELQNRLRFEQEEVTRILSTPISPVAYARPLNPVAETERVSAIQMLEARLRDDFKAVERFLERPSLAHLRSLLAETTRQTLQFGAAR